MKNTSKEKVMRYRSVSKNYVVNHGNYENYIPVKLCISVRDQVLMVIDVLEPKQKYTLEELCGEKFWRGLNNPIAQRKAGLFMADMVRKGILPLKFAGKKGTTRLYEFANVKNH